MTCGEVDGSGGGTSTPGRNGTTGAGGCEGEAEGEGAADGAVDGTASGVATGAADGLGDGSGPACATRHGVFSNSRTCLASPAGAGPATAGANVPAIRARPTANAMSPRTSVLLSGLL